MTTSHPESAPLDTPQARIRAARLDADSKVAAPFEQAGELLAFAIRAIRDVPVAVRLYPSEVLRQAGLFVRSNAVVVLFMLFMLGSLMGITGTFLLETLGLDSYIAAIPAVPIMRGVVEIVFGWILAAKAGCGIVAELGAMRISEEIDAMEVMGIRSIPYLVGTRIAAALIVLPFLWVTALWVHFFASELFDVKLLSTVSEGGFEYVLFLMQSPRDFLIALVWALVVGLIVTVVACYYGYNAKGGPVGVGQSTAQAMLVNLVLISITGMILAQIFYANTRPQAFGT